MPSSELGVGDIKFIALLQKLQATAMVGVVGMVLRMGHPSSYTWPSPPCLGPGRQPCLPSPLLGVDVLSFFGGPHAFYPRDAVSCLIQVFSLCSKIKGTVEVLPPTHFQVR